MSQSSNKNIEIIDNKEENKELEIPEKPKKYCNNCGIFGHKFKECNFPKTSYGIVCTKKEKNNINFLLICRRNSLSYIEFIRGRYKMFDTNLIFTLFKHMTKDERNDILIKSFDTLWDDLWINNKYKKSDIRSDYEKGKTKFMLLKMGTKIVHLNILISLEYIVRNTYSIYDEPEWDFPKGRRNVFENDIECAVREFCEETNFKENDFDVIDDKESYVEIHRGTNGIRYRTVYFAGKITTTKKPIVDKNNKHQTMEISDIGWFNYENAIARFRDYEEAKKRVIEDVYKRLVRDKIDLNNNKSKS